MQWKLGNGLQPGMRAKDSQVPTLQSSKSTLDLETMDTQTLLVVWAGPEVQSGVPLSPPPAPPSIPLNQRHRRTACRENSPSPAGAPPEPPPSEPYNSIRTGGLLLGTWECPWSCIRAYIEFGAMGPDCRKGNYPCVHRSCGQEFRWSGNGDTGVRLVCC